MTDNRTNEPTEAMILAALNAYSSKGLEIDGYDPVDEYPSLDMWGERFASQMRAALVAAQGATTEELAKIKPLFENLSREYPNECNKRVKAEAERDAALEAIERVRETLMLHNPNGRLVKEVLAALDGAPKPEWEYQNLKHVHGVDHRWVGDKPGEDTTHRRRKAGPWEPVEGEQP